MAVKLRGLDRYEVEAIQYDGTNSDEICQFILEHKPYTQIEGAFLNKGTDKKMMAVIVISSGEDILVREKEWLVHVEVPYGNQNSFYVMNFGRWLPKRVVTPIDDTHIGIPKKFLEETIELLAKGHPFREVRYNAQFKQETLQWTKPTKPEKS